MDVAFLHIYISASEVLTSGAKSCTLCFKHSTERTCDIRILHLLVLLDDWAVSVFYLRQRASYVRLSCRATLDVRALLRLHRIDWVC